MRLRTALDRYEQEVMKVHAYESSLEKNVAVLIEDLEFLQESIQPVEEILKQKSNPWEFLNISRFLRQRLQNLEEQVSMSQKPPMDHAFRLPEENANIESSLRFALQQLVPLGSTNFQAI